MLAEGQNVYYLASNGIIHQCTVDMVAEEKAHLKCKNGSFEITTSIHNSRIFEHYADAERYLYI